MTSRYRVAVFTVTFEIVFDTEILTLKACEDMQLSY